MQITWLRPHSNPNKPSTFKSKKSPQKDLALQKLHHLAGQSITKSISLPDKIKTINHFLIFLKGINFFIGIYLCLWKLDKFRIFIRITRGKNGKGF